MTVWTEADNGVTQVYDEGLTGSVWDSGASVWDVEGNVILSYWDVAAGTSWVDSAGQSASWVEQSGNAATWTEVSGNAMTWVNA